MNIAKLIRVDDPRVSTRSAIAGGFTSNLHPAMAAPGFPPLPKFDYSSTVPRIQITRAISIDENELTESATRASGAGGQHVNTTDSAVILRFDVAASPSLPEAVKRRLTELAGSRITNDGVLILRSEGSRSQFENKREVKERLFALVHEATLVPKKRKPTRPTKASNTRRVDAKTRRSAVKAGRGKWQE